MKKYGAIVIVIGLLLSMSACQPTPDRQVVIGKDTDILEQVAKATTEPKTSQEIEGESGPRYEAPSRWEAKYEKYDGRFKMVIDADVVVGDAESYPVVKIKPYHIPIEQANKIVKAIFGDQEVYHNQMNLTKDQLESMIIDAKAEKRKAEKDGDDECIQMEQDHIDYLMRQLEDAPEEATFRPYTGEYDIYEGKDGTEHSIALRLNPLDKKTPVLSIHDRFGGMGNGYNTSTGYENCGDESYKNYVYQEEEDIHWDFRENPLCQSEEAKAARAIADAFIESIGIEDHEINLMWAMTSKYGDEEIVGYRMEYGRVFNGMVLPPRLDFGCKVALSENEFACPFQMEWLVVEVEGDTIKDFYWDNAYELDKTLIEDVSLLPFEEIMANAETQLAVKYAFVENNNQNAYMAGNDAKYDYFVDKIILTYMVEQIRNERYQYMLVPVWAFYGGDDYGDGYEFCDGTVRRGRHHSPVSLLTVNAVDGSIIGG